MTGPVAAVRDRRRRRRQRPARKGLDRLPATPLVAVGSVTTALYQLPGGADVPFLPVHVEASPLLGLGGAVVLSAGILLSGIRARELDELRTAAANADLGRADAEDRLTAALDAGQELLRLHLRAIAAELGFGAQERISLYRSEGTTLTRYARFCKNPVLADGGRLHITDPENEAPLVAEALRTGRPIRASVDTSSQRAWEQSQQSQHGLPLKVSTALRMRPALYLVFPLTDTATGLLIAALVLESERGGGIKLREAKAAIVRYDDLIARSVVAVGRSTDVANASSTAAGDGGAPA